jgi:hypothetical protein
VSDIFVQVIEGRAKDWGGLRRELDRWHAELKPGADGYLGDTSGITDEGRFVSVVRFDSEEAARRNSDRPEQGRWWEAFAKNLEGEANFLDSVDVVTFLGGGSDDAGFVQVIRGRSGDIDRLRALEREMEEPLRQHRPDLIGGTFVVHPGGEFTEAAYFISEREAREGERKEMPAQLAAQFEEMMSLIRDVVYLDLREPWLSSR